VDRLVGVIRRYSNRPDLLEQLRKVAVILSDGGQDDGAGMEVTTECVIRSRRLRDRFSPEDLRSFSGSLKLVHGGLLITPSLSQQVSDLTGPCCTHGEPSFFKSPLVGYSFC
jgi:hypothetical protein